MANGFVRTRARKTIALPGGDSVDIPVLLTVAVADQNGQETQLGVENGSANQTRQVHVDEVHSTHGTAGAIFVERIDSWIGLDVIERAQESNFFIDNKTGADLTPPHFSTHQKTHVYRYYQNPNNPDDSGAWVDSELIDEISVTDQNGQEWIYFLLGNPQPGDMTGQADPNDPNITDSSLDPPYRTDPFQNIVDFNGHSTTTGFVPPFCLVVDYTVGLQLLLYGGKAGPVAEAPSSVGLNVPDRFFDPAPGDAGTSKGAIGTLVGSASEIDNINNVSQGFNYVSGPTFDSSSVSWHAIGDDGTHDWTINVAAWTIVATNGFTYSFSTAVAGMPVTGGLPSRENVKYTLTFCR